MKLYKCRDHDGGVFKMPPRRGRPPVRCTAEYPCTKVRPEIEAATPSEKPAESVAEAAKPDNPSLPLAMDTKGQLEALGWVVVGKAKGAGAQLSATRGAETLIMLWVDGAVVKQEYLLSYVKPSDNGIPPHSLSFEPDELTNSELVQILRGMQVTWWNTLGNSRETAVIGNKVSIEHIYDDDREKRIVKFIDHSGGGFRAFHVAALLKVG